MVRKHLRLAAMVGVFAVVFGCVGQSELFQPKNAVFLKAMAGELIRGHMSGAFPAKSLSADFCVLEPGDILLCHNPDGSYGYWTHAVLYVGQRSVVDAYDFERGTELRSVDSYQRYAELMVLRLDAPRSLRERVAETARLEVGKPYDPLSSLQDTRTQYCSKLIWQNFARAHVVLCQPQAWVLPDDLAQSPRLHIVARWATT